MSVVEQIPWDSSSEIVDEARKQLNALNIVTNEEEAFPAIAVCIGGYKLFIDKDVSVTAYFSYGAEKLQWEIVEGPLRRKIVVEWADITEIQLRVNECCTPYLIVKVDHSPSFWIHRPESKDEWLPTMDFTNGEAVSKLLPHYVVFQPGTTVDESYGKLLNYSKKLASLNKKDSEEKMIE